MGLQEFLGYRHPEAIIMLNAFTSSPIVVSGGVALIDEPTVAQDALLLEGPRYQLEFLFPFLVRLRDDSIDSNEFGFWTGAFWSKKKDAVAVNYMFGSSLQDRIELLTEKFRRDMVFSCRLKLNQKATLMVKLGGEIILRESLNLPQGIANGDIEIPVVEKPKQLLV